MNQSWYMINSTFWKGFGLALEAFSDLYYSFIKFVSCLKIGGDRYRRDNSIVELHAEDNSSLLNYLLQL